MEIGKDLGGTSRVVGGTGAWGSRWDRYLGMTAAMTQVPVPTASSGSISKKAIIVFNTSEIKQMQFREISIEVGAINPSALFTKPLIFTWSILDKPFISPK
jgi:hypothetical protein